MRIGSLFSGIGGLELGLERAGCGSVAWQVERDPFCRSVLAKHWPSAERFDDVCAVGSHCLAAVDIVCGGFPCQDLSYAGKGAGLAGERSGLWREYARIVRELRPRFVVVENVSALLARGLGDVLGDLAALGYDAEWHCVRASDVGAPHRRERLFVVAYRDGGRSQGERGCGVLDGERTARGDDSHGCSGAPLAHAIGREPERAREPGDVAGEARGAQGEGDERQRVRDAARGSGPDVAHPHASGRGERPGASGKRRGLAEPADGGSMGHANGSRLEERAGERSNDGAQFEAVERAGCELADARGTGRGPRSTVERGERGERGEGQTDRSSRHDPGLPEPRLGLSAHGLPGRVARWLAGPGEEQQPWEAPRTIGRCDNRAARLKALGNAVVPQVAEVIGGIVMRLAAWEGRA